MEEGNNPVTEQSAAPKKKRNTGLIIAIVLLVLCCLCVAFSYVMYQWGFDMIYDWIMQNVQFS